MVTEQTALTDRERLIVEQVAKERGITVEEAAEQLCKEALAARIRRKTGHAPAKVYELRKK